MVTAAAPRVTRLPSRGVTVSGPDRAVPTSALPRRSTDDLLALARYGLSEAMLATRASERYAFAHVAALRAAAAMLAQRAKPVPASSRRRRPSSAWLLLASVAPEFSEWAAFFAAGAAKRAAAEAGVSTAVTAREADDLMRDAEAFLSVVSTALGKSHQQALVLPPPSGGVAGKPAGGASPPPSGAET